MWLNQGGTPAVMTAMAKYYATETMRKVVNHGMDIAGGRAIQLGPRNFLALTYQAIPIAITVEGANILTRSLMILVRAQCVVILIYLKSYNSFNLKIKITQSKIR